MATSIQSLQFAPLGSDGSNRVASVVLNSGTDTLFNINNTGTGQGSDVAENIEIRWVLVDNLLNNGYVTLTMGNFTVRIPPFQRESVGVPTGTRVFSIQLFTGAIYITFSETRLADNQSDALLVQQTSVKTLIFGFKFYNVDTAQIADDVNSSILFTPTIGNMEYLLLPMVGGQVGNGWIQYLDNAGNKNVTIRPSPGDTMNSALVFQYTNTSPLILAPGQSGYLRSDGVRWYIDGTYEMVAPATPAEMVAGVTNRRGVTPFNLPFHPLVASALLRVANLTVANPSLNITFSLLGATTCTRLALGSYRLNWTNAVNNLIAFPAVSTSAVGRLIQVTPLTGTSLSFNTFTDSGAPIDPDISVALIIFGTI